MKTQYISALLWYHNGDEEQKKTGFGVEMMYQKESERVKMTLEDFILPFGGKLDAGNRFQILDTTMILRKCGRMGLLQVHLEARRMAIL